MLNDYLAQFRVWLRGRSFLHRVSLYVLRGILVEGQFLLYDGPLLGGEVLFHLVAAEVDGTHQLVGIWIFLVLIGKLGEGCDEVQHFLRLEEPLAYQRHAFILVRSSDAVSGDLHRIQVVQFMRCALLLGLAQFAEDGHVSGQSLEGCFQVAMHQVLSFYRDGVLVRVEVGCYQGVLLGDFRFRYFHHL